MKPSSFLLIWRRALPKIFQQVKTQQEFNGLIGCYVGPHRDSGRFVIKLDDGRVVNVDHDKVEVVTSSKSSLDGNLDETIPKRVSIEVDGDGATS